MIEKAVCRLLDAVGGIGIALVVFAYLWLCFTIGVVVTETVTGRSLGIYSPVKGWDAMTTDVIRIMPDGTYVHSIEPNGSFIPRNTNEHKP